MPDLVCTLARCLAHRRRQGGPPIGRVLPRHAASARRCARARHERVKDARRVQLLSVHEGVGELTPLHARRLVNPDERGCVGSTGSSRSCPRARPATQRFVESRSAARLLRYQFGARYFRIVASLRPLRTVSVPGPLIHVSSPAKVRRITVIVHSRQSALFGWRIVLPARGGVVSLSPCATGLR